MERIVRIIRKNSIVVILTTIILMLTITIGVKAATMYASRDVIYENSSSGTTASTVQEALDELYVKSDSCGGSKASCISTNGTVSYALGTSYTCDVGDGTERIFYVLEDNGDSVDLIMNENIVNNVEWNEYGYNSFGPETANNALILETFKWTVEAKLPTGQQIADAVGDTSWPSALAIYLTSAPWLYGNLNSSSLRGYWTSTPYSASSSQAWYVSSKGQLDQRDVDGINTYTGVRPVITVSKSQLS